MNCKFKLISIVLVIALMVSVIPAFAVEDDTIVETATDPVGTVYFEENFEGFAVGAESLTGYGGGAKGNIWNIREEENGNKYRAMEITTDVDMHLDKTLSTPPAGHLILEGKFLFEDYKQKRGKIYYHRLCYITYITTFSCSIVSHLYYDAESPSDSLRISSGLPPSKEFLSKIAFIMSPSDGISNIASDSAPSTIARSPRAPVSRSIAL